MCACVLKRDREIEKDANYSVYYRTSAIHQKKITLYNHLVVPIYCILLCVLLLLYQLSRFLRKGVKLYR